MFLQSTKIQVKWAIMNPGDEMPTPRATRRFETTSLAGTEDVAARRAEVSERRAALKVIVHQVCSE